MEDDAVESAAAPSSILDLPSSKPLADFRPDVLALEYLNGFDQLYDALR